MKQALLLLFLVPMLSWGQHTISGTFSPAKDFSYVLVYRSTPTGTDYITQAKLSEDGSFTVTLENSQPKGLYKLVYAIPAEENNFNLFYNGNENVVVNFDLEHGPTFMQSKDNMLWMDYTYQMGSINGHINSLYTKDPIDKKALNQVFDEQRQIQSNYENQAKDLMVEAFIKANRFYIPDQYEPISEYGKHIKENYISTLDFSNEYIQSSDFMLDRITTYVFEMTKNTEESYKNSIDNVATAVGNHPDVAKVVLGTLWKAMTETGNDTMANYITDAYLLDMAKNTNDKFLEQTLTDYKKTSLGSKAHDFEFTYLNKENKPVKTSLYELQGANRYLLIFWSSTCSHCLSELPQVKTLMDRHPDVQVIAYALESGVKNWKDTITQFPNFLHTYDLDKWDSKTAKTYGVSATPTYFVLDKNKTILAKPDQLENLKSYFDNSQK